MNINSKLIFTLFAITTISSYVHSEKADGKEQPEILTGKCESYSFKDKRLTAFLLEDFFRSCGKEEILENVLKKDKKIIGNATSTKESYQAQHDFFKEYSCSGIRSTIEAKSTTPNQDTIKDLEKDLGLDFLDSKDLSRLYDLGSILYISDEHSVCLIHLFRGSVDNKLRATVDCHTSMCNPQLVEESAQQVAAEKEQAKEKPNQTAK